MKEIKITVPDNYELKQDGNNYTIVKKEKKVTYEDVVRELFYNKSGCYITAKGDICNNDWFSSTTYKDATNCTSPKQAEKLLAINKLMNVAKYLNGDWQPDWNNGEVKFFINLRNDVFKVSTVVAMQCEDIYFKSEELAKKAIEILGEETIKLALCIDY